MRRRLLRVDSRRPQGDRSTDGQAHLSALSYGVVGGRLTFSLRFDRGNKAPTVRDVTERIAPLTEGACGAPAVGAAESDLSWRSTKGKP
jgi:hypothetical protein